MKPTKKNLASKKTMCCKKCWSKAFKICENWRCVCHKKTPSPSSKKNENMKKKYTSKNGSSDGGLIYLSTKKNLAQTGWEAEFDKNVNYDEAELGCNWGMDELKSFIRKLLLSARSESYEKAYQDISKRFRIREQELLKMERKKEQDRWLNQSANAHDERIRKDERTKVIAECLEAERKVKTAHTYQGRLSNCHNSLVIMVEFDDESCLLFCEKCGKTCGFYKISQ